MTHQRGRDNKWTLFPSQEWLDLSRSVYMYMALLSLKGAERSPEVIPVLPVDELPLHHQVYHRPPVSVSTYIYTAPRYYVCVCR